VDVRKVDLAMELQILSFHEQRKASAGVTQLPSGSGDQHAPGRPREDHVVRDNSQDEKAANE
jgi:hypothetical protein